jgi:hypothetical protein
MTHPFDMDMADIPAADLDFEEPLSEAEAAEIGGSFWATTMALGEEGGDYFPRPRPLPNIRPRPRPLPNPKPDPICITRALGEDGGDCPPLIGPPDVTTLALGEEGGDWPPLQ